MQSSHTDRRHQPPHPYVNDDTVKALDSDSFSLSHLGIISFFAISFIIAIASIRLETSVSLSYFLIALTSVLAAIGLHILPRENWRSKECLSITLWAGPLFLAANALSLSVEDMMVPTGVLGLIVGLWAKTRLPALAGLFALMATAALSSATIIGPINMNVYQGCGLVATIFGYLGLAGHVQSRGILLSTLICLSLWASYWVFNASLSPQHLSLLAFMVSATFYKVGRTGLEDGTFGSMSLLVTGWIIGTLSFLSLQWGYLEPEPENGLNQMKRIYQNPYTSMPWFIGMACAMGILAVIGIMRLTKNRYTVVSVVVSFTILLTIPFVVMFPENFPGLNTAAMAIALTIMVGLSLLMKSFNNDNDTYFYLALFTLALQGVLLFKANLVTSQDITLFFNNLTGNS